MLIAICDDEQAFRDELHAFIFRYKAERRLHIDVYEYPNGEALLKSKIVFDMVFLDYQMPGLDGMEVARKLRSWNLMCNIVFVTNFPQFVFESFEVQPYRFYPKPFLETQFVELITTFIAHQKLLHPLTIIQNREQITIQAKDILYLEGAGKYCIVRTVDNTYRSSKTLAQTHALMPQHCFYRCHKSYVVNLYSVCSLSSRNNTATLTNGEFVSIGHGTISKFRQIYKQFVKDYYVKV